MKRKKLAKLGLKSLDLLFVSLSCAIGTPLYQVRISILAHTVTTDYKTRHLCGQFVHLSV